MSRLSKKPRLVYFDLHFYPFCCLHSFYSITCNEPHHTLLFSPVSLISDLMLSKATLLWLASQSPSCVWAAGIVHFTATRHFCFLQFCRALHCVCRARRWVTYAAGVPWKFPEPPYSSFLCGGLLHEPGQGSRAKVWSASSAERGLHAPRGFPVCTTSGKESGGKGRGARGSLVCSLSLRGCSLRLPASDRLQNLILYILLSF